MEVGPSCLGRSGEELSYLLEEDVVPGLGRKADNDTVVGQTAKVIDHLLELVVGVMNGDIDACDEIVLARHTLQVTRVEVSLDAHLFGPTSCLGSHGITDIRGRDLGTHLRQGDGQTADTASTVADRLSGDVAIRRNPIQNLLDGLIVTGTNVELHRVHVVRLGIDLVPSVEAFGVEVFTDFCLVVDAGEQSSARSSLWCDHKGRSGDEERGKDRKAQHHGRIVLPLLTFSRSHYFNLTVWSSHEVGQVARRHPRSTLHSPFSFGHHHDVLPLAAGPLWDPQWPILCSAQ